MAATSSMFIILCSVLLRINFEFILKSRGGEVINVHVDIGRGSFKCPRLSTWGGEGVKNGQNLVHVVIVRPPSGYTAPLLEGVLWVPRNPLNFGNYYH